MATLEQLEEGIKRAHEAGNAEHVRALGAAYRQMQQEGAAPQQLQGRVTPQAMRPTEGSANIEDRRPPGRSPITTDSIYAAARQAGGIGQQAPTEQAVVEGNRFASSLPGPIGDFQNTLRANMGGQSQGITANFADELFAGVTALPKAIGSTISGNGFDLGREFTSGLEQTQQADKEIRSLNPGAYESGELTGALMMTGKAGAAPAVARPIQSAGKTAVKGATIGGAYGGASGFGRGETMEERLYLAARGAVTGAALGGATGYAVGKFAAPKTPVPTTAEMKATAKKAFNASEATGAVISQPSVAVYADELQNMLKAEGLITPSGKVAGYPGVSHALNLIDDFAQGNTTIMQAKTIRKQLGRAAGSIDPAEREIAVRMIEQFDDFMQALRPGNFAAGNGKEAVNQWIKARSAYHVAKKGESVEALIATAERKHRKSRAVGIDAATRNQFDNFVSNDKNLRGFNPAERAALTRVSEGTRAGNVGRTIGGLAPSSAAGITVKGGVPFGIGTLLSGGNPVVGGAVAGATLGVGMAGRIVANMSSKQQAALASLIVRNGGRLPTPQMLPPIMRQAFGGLLATEGAQSPRLGAALLQMISQNSQGGRTPTTQTAAQ